MGRPLYTNNAATYLAFGITNTATTMQVSANAGSLFPNPTGGDYFYVSLISLSGPIIEIVKCTARSGDILTIERGQEGTSALYWNMGDNVQLRITAAGMNYIAGAAVQSTEEQVFTATQGQTVFTLTNFDYAPGTNNLAVFVNGSKQVYGTNYSETSVNTVTFNSGLNAGDIVEFLVGISVASGTLYANEINYNEGGVGAVTTTVQSKLQETISVLDFGAVGNGIADDTAAFQAALNAGAGNTVNVPAGNYLITSTLTMLANTTLQGSSSAFGLESVLITPTDIITLTATTTAPNTGVPIYGLTVKNLRFSNTLPVVAGAGMTNVQLKFIEPALAQIQNCTFVSKLLDTDYNINNAGGIWLTNGTAGGAWLNRVEDCGIQGHVIFDVTDSIITTSYVYGLNGSFGIKFNGSNNTVSDCWDLNGSRLYGSVWLNNVTNCRVINNFFDVEGFGVYSNQGYGNIITGNSANGTAYAPIQLNDPLNFSVVGNTFTNCGTLDLGASSSDICVNGVTLVPQHNSFVGNTHTKNNTRTNQSFAIIEQNLGYAPISNTYVGNSITSSSTQYYTPAIGRTTTTGITSSKLVANTGKGTDTEYTSTFTPTWTSSITNPVLGNGTLSGWVTRSNNLINVNIKLVAGTTTTFGSGIWYFSMPAANAGSDTLGTVLGIHAGAFYTAVVQVLAGASATNVIVYNADSAGSWGSAIPVTWASGDTIDISITYMVA